MKLTVAQRKLTCGIAAIAAVVSSIGLVSSVVGALPPNTPPAGTFSMTPSTGDSGTTFGLSFESAQFCPGDAVAGYLWGTFLTSSTNDPATLTFSVSGNPIAPAGFTTTLRDPTGTPIRNQNPGLTDGVVNAPGQLSFAGVSFGAVPPGTYWLGIACTKLDSTVVIQNEKYWAIAVTITASPGGGPNNFAFGPATVATTTTTTVAGTTSTTVAGATTTTVAGATTTTVAGATTTTVAGATTTTVAGSAAQAATLSPAVPTPGGLYRVTHPNCRVGDTITVTQPQSTPTTQTATCAVPVAGLVRPQQAPTVGTATVTFTAAPTAAGTYTVTSSGPNSGTRTATFTIAAAASTPASSGGSPSGTSTGTIPATGSSTTSVIVWGILLLVFGRMAILLGRKPKVIQAGG